MKPVLQLVACLIAVLAIQTSAIASTGPDGYTPVFTVKGGAVICLSDEGPTRVSRDIYRFWTKTVENKESLKGHSNTSELDRNGLSYSLILIEYDLRNNKSRILEAIPYDDNGDRIESLCAPEGTEYPWGYAPPGSPDARIIELIKGFVKYSP